MIEKETQKTIIKHFEELDIWKTFWAQSAVVIVGSSVRGIKDEFTDIDILAFVPQISYDTVYEGYRQAVEANQIKVLNPKAFKYNEFPLSFIPTIAGHYEVKAFEEVEESVENYDDITMWIHQSAVILHDASGRYRELQKSCSYPDDVWKAKVRFHYLQAEKAANSTDNPLPRNDQRTVVLIMADCVAHLLRLCCLLERRPFPYDKWLYREAMQTQAGQDLKSTFERFFEELSRPEIRRVEPKSYQRPGHRKADLEAYPLHMIWREAEEYVERRIEEMF